MRNFMACASSFSAVAVWTSLMLLPASAEARGPLPLAVCRDVVGSYLTTISSEEGFASRSLLSFTDAGILLVTDSEQGGGADFAPFTSSQGAWQCESRRRGTIKISAIALNFTEDETIGRLDYEIIFDTRSNELLEGRIELFFVPLGGDPLDPLLVPVSDFTFTWQEINPIE